MRTRDDVLRQYRAGGFAVLADDIYKMADRILELEQENEELTFRIRSLEK